ncbi:DUF5641 domain-containing protein [Trichonephila clavipes]|nr:DUF5641 domain-containing protein [Trichonephila clavipes]
MLSQNFDPIGFTCPVTLVPKLILQDCWREKINWDTELPDILGKEFLKWANELSCLKDIEIPRKLPELNESATRHVFVDASKSAYAASFLLEAVIRVLLAVNYCRLGLNECVILDKERRQLGYVYRVNEIRKLTDPEAWRHIQGKFNPADLPSRGCNPKVLWKSHWWEGPDWLKLLHEEWPASEIKPDMEIVISERRRTVLTATT